MKFSEKIIQARKTKALTQEDLADAVGVSRQAVSKWETEEAKPDLDKLVGLCKVLDLSMDYLCLDKTQEPTLQTQLQETTVKVTGKPYLFIGVCIGLVVALLVGMLVTALMPDEIVPTQPVLQQTGTVDTTALDYSFLLNGLEVADAHCELMGARKWRILFVPSVEVPGMQVQIAVLDKQLGTTYYMDATKAGAGYVVDYKVPERAYDFDIIAVCSLGEVFVQFSLIHMESFDGIGMHWEPIWKE